MDSQIELSRASDLDRKYLVAFFKGLVSIKYADLFAKVAKANNEEAPEVMDLDFLYSNLFNQEVTPPEVFNQLVESGLRLIEDLLEQNLPKEKLDDYLTRRVRAADESRKAVTQFWKAE